MSCLQIYRSLISSVNILNVTNRERMFLTQMSNEGTKHNHLLYLSFCPFRFFFFFLSECQNMQMLLEMNCDKSFGDRVTFCAAQITVTKLGICACVSKGLLPN